MNAFDTNIFVYHGFTVQEAWENLADWMLSFPLALPSEDVLDRARVLHVEKQ